MYLNRSGYPETLLFGSNRHSRPFQSAIIRQRAGLHKGSVAHLADAVQIEKETTARSWASMLRVPDSEITGSKLLINRKFPQRTISSIPEGRENTNLGG